MLWKSQFFIFEIFFYVGKVNSDVMSDTYTYFSL